MFFKDQGHSKHGMRPLDRKTNQKSGVQMSFVLVKVSARVKAASRGSRMAEPRDRFWSLYILQTQPLQKKSSKKTSATEFGVFRLITEFKKIYRKLISSDYETNISGQGSKRFT